MNLKYSLNLSKISKPIVASYTTVDGDSIVDFLRQVRKYSKIKGTIHLILDQAGYNCCDEVANAAAKLNIKCHIPRKSSISITYPLKILSAIFPTAPEAMKVIPIFVHFV